MTDQIVNIIERILTNNDYHLPYLENLTFNKSENKFNLFPNNKLKFQKTNFNLSDFLVQAKR